MSADHVNFVEGPRGFTEHFDDHTVDILVRMGLIHHTHDDYVLLTYRGDEKVGTGPIHRFYKDGS